MHMTLEASTRN